MRNKLFVSGLTIISIMVAFTAANAADRVYRGSIFFNPQCPAFGNFSADVTVHDDTITGHIDGKHRIDGRFEGIINAEGRWNARGVDPAGQVMTLMGSVGPQEISATMEGHNRDDIHGPCFGELTVRANP